MAHIRNEECRPIKKIGTARNTEWKPRSKSGILSLEKTLTKPLTWPQFPYKRPSNPLVSASFVGLTFSLKHFVYSFLFLSLLQNPPKTLASFFSRRLACLPSMEFWGKLLSYSLSLYRTISVRVRVFFHLTQFCLSFSVPSSLFFFVFST